MLTQVLDLGGPWAIAAAVIDILLVAYLFYRVLLLIKGTTAVPMLAGLGVIGLSFYASRWAGLTTLHWLLGHFLQYSLIFGVIVIFQADIRRGLARLGRGWNLTVDKSGEASRIEEVVRAAVKLSQRRHGALIVMERRADLEEYADGGVRLDAEVSEELLLSIFQPGSPLHDGAVIIGRGRVIAAKCVLPLTASPDVARDVGTRHRSAIGLSEEVDAVVLVVSEERGLISLAMEGELYRDLDPDTIRKALLRMEPPRRKERAA